MAEMWCTVQEFKNVAVVLADSVKNEIITTAQVNEIIVESTADLKQLLTGVFDLSTVLQNIPIIDPNNLLLLKFDNLTDPITYVDSSSNPHVITPINAPLQQSTTKKFGGAVSFDGFTQYLSIGNPSSLGILNDFTIECWAYPTAVGVHKSLYSQNTSAGVYMTFGLTTADNSLYFQVKDGGYSPLLTSVNPTTLNQWNHVAVCKNGATTRLFINGIVEATNTDNVLLNIYTNDSVIGKVSTSLNGLMAGSIDDFRLSNIARYGATNFTPPSTALSEYTDNYDSVPAALVKLTKLKSAIMAVDRFGINDKLRVSWDMEYRDTLEVVQSGILLDSDDNEIDPLGQPELIRGNDPDILRDIYEDSDRYGQRILTESD